MNKKQSFIPIKNIWSLIFYASDMLKHAKSQGKEEIEKNIDDIPILMAEILSKAVKERIRRNLNFNYRPRQEILKRVRGRIDIFKTERHQLLEKAQIACRFEELTIDTPRNRFVRDALEEIAILVLFYNKNLRERGVEKKIIKYNRNLANKCRALAITLRQSGVIGVRPDKREILSERFGRNDVNDRFMVLAALLVFELALPTETMGDNFLPKFDRDRDWLSQLFERAVAGFYNFYLTSHGWKVQSQKPINWQRGQESGGIKDILPDMRSDVILTKGKERQIIIDTKFQKILSQSGDRKIKSENIYQIYAYLRSQEGQGYLADHAEGLLLHPSVGYDLDEYTTIQNHKIRFATVNLDTTPTEVRNQLIKIIDPNLI